MNVVYLIIISNIIINIVMLVQVNTFYRY